jgi:hypothetical protein
MGLIDDVTGLFGNSKNYKNPYNDAKGTMTDN